MEQQQDNQIPLQDTHAQQPVVQTPVQAQQQQLQTETMPTLAATESNSANATIPTSTITPMPTLTPTPPPSRYVLLDKDEKIIFLLTAKSIRIEKYIDKRCFIRF